MSRNSRRSHRFRFPGFCATCIGLLALQANGLVVGCSGRTSAAGSASSSASDDGGAAASAGKPATSNVSGGAAGGSKANGGAAGKSNASAGKGGRPSSDGGGAGGNTSSDAGDAGSPSESGGGSGGSGGNAGTLGSGGHGPGQYICIDNVCGYQCIVQNNIADPGADFWPDCNKCHCNPNGFADCEAKDCDKDCAYLDGEYQGAWGELEYCLLEDINHPDPCLRTQISTLSCRCPEAVSSNPEFIAITSKWSKKWDDAGCTKPADLVCPPCKIGSGPYCDEGVCAYKN